MYGYVRPVRSELRVREYEAFRSVYCGLCHSLGHSCGVAARFVVNYELTLLTMLLYESGEPSLVRRRCMAGPFRRRTCLAADPALDLAADYSVILARWKLRDTVADEGFFRALPARASLLLLHRAGCRAVRRAPDFDAKVEEGLARLSALEGARCESLDRMADGFAKILQSAAVCVRDKTRRRVLSQLLYHLGRTVYILDAVDDLAEDARTGRYNPLICRFDLQNGVLSEEQRATLRLTLRHSQNMIVSAFQLLSRGPWTDILENILYLGLPQVTELVLTGKWKNRKKLSMKQIGVMS